MKRLSIGLVMMIMTLSACSQKPAEIHYNSDQCMHCKMMITDAQFASQIVSDKGKAYKFDAVECMLQYRAEKPGTFEAAKFWVNDYSQPGTWVKAKEAIYVQSEKIQSPMGASLMAFKSLEVAQDHIESYPGQILNWQELQEVELHMNGSKPDHNMSEEDQ